MNQITSGSYIYEGDESSLLTFFSTQGEFTFSKHYFSVLGIDDARELKLGSLERENDTRHAHLIFVSGIHIEAQNALLKFFEEPKDNYIFVLIIPNKKDLLPTLLSRFQVIENTEGIKNVQDAKIFLSLDLPARLSYIEKFLKEHEEDDSLRSLVNDFYDTTIRILKDKSILEKEILEMYVSLKPLIPTRGSSPKIILEYLAYALPKI